MRTSLILLVMAALAVLSCGCGVQDPVFSGRSPEIFPDYRDVTVPATIAPLDFVLDGTERLAVTLTGEKGGTLHVEGTAARFPRKAWRKLLAGNKGAAIKVEIFALEHGQWLSYIPFNLHVSEDAIDYGLVYRLILPSYEGMGKLGIYQRELSSYRQQELVSTEEVNGCINCHSFNRGDPKDMSLHVRGSHGATLIRHGGGSLEAFTTKTDSTISSCVYPYWHPSGNYVAYSTNTTRQGFYQRAENVLEVFDYASDVVVYDIRRNRLLSSPLLKGDGAWETFPAFSPDGKTLYFCSAAPRSIPEELGEVRYNLCSIAFDPEEGTFADTVDTLVLAAPAGYSVSFPRPSYDGRFLMYTVSSFGNFLIWHNDSDLRLLDLESGRTLPLDEANSPAAADSYHSWSSNSRWFVFGSRREDQTHTRAYLCHIDADGVPGKPFLLPQRNPRVWYNSHLLSFNIPEFVTEPVRFDSHKAWRKLRSHKREQFGYQPW